MAKSATFTSTFDSYDTGIWYRSNATNVAFTSGQLVLTATTSYHYLVSTGDYDMTDSHFAVEFVQNLNVGSNGSLSTYFRALDSSGDGSNYFEFEIAGGPSGTVTFREKYNGSSDTTTGTYDATNYRYLRLREASGTIYWETSPNGYSWTTRRSKSALVSVSVADVLLSTGRWAAESSPGNAIFDNLNLMPSEPQPSSNFFSFI